MAGMGLLTGCSALQQNPPAGSLVVENRDSLPHLVEINFVNGPQDAVEIKQGTEAVVPIEPNSKKTYKKVFSSKGVYEIHAEYENGNKISFSANPYSTQNGKIVVIRIEKYGNLTYVVEQLNSGLL